MHELVGLRTDQRVGWLSASETHTSTPPMTSMMGFAKAQPILYRSDVQHQSTDVDWLRGPICREPPDPSVP